MTYLRIATILLVCSLSCVLAQYGEEAGGGGGGGGGGPVVVNLPKKISAGRLKQSARLGPGSPPSQTSVITQRFRRPIPIKRKEKDASGASSTSVADQRRANAIQQPSRFEPRSRPRPSAEPIPELPVFTSGIRGSRPSAPLNLNEQSDEAPGAPHHQQQHHPQQQQQQQQQQSPVQTVQQPQQVRIQPQQHQSHQQDLKPVNEENEKDEDVVQVIANLGAVSGFGGQGNLLTPTAASVTPSSSPGLSAYQIDRQADRQIQPVHYRPPPQIARSSANAGPDAIHQVIAPVQYKPQKPIRLQKQQQQQQQKLHHQQQQQQQQQKQQQQQQQLHHQQQHVVERNEYDLNEARPAPKQRVQAAPPKKSKPQQADYYEGRTKKPVAQVIRRYREETPDGSIIWGFENDDGSFKEEMIGIDCITRGKYGYVDPDGQRREYTYETGIKCDEETQQQQDQDILNTFVDYQENKLVLPSGKTIDLSSMGKKQSRRPQNIYRN